MTMDVSALLTVTVLQHHVTPQILMPACPTALEHPTSPKIASVQVTLSACQGIALQATLARAPAS
ncbi:MAG: hypothetical protein ACMG6E_06580, partial [Candidatus Roizmanbacteria bacterium]